MAASSTSPGRDPQRHNPGRHLAILDPAYSEVELVGLDGSGNLDGPFVSTANTPARVKRDDGEFLFKRADQPFKEVMVYFHIDRVQRYLQQLGFRTC